MSKSQWMYLLMVIAAAVTVYGLFTGKFLFLLVLLPLGVFWRNNKK
jgi:hypothetical protein